MLDFIECLNDSIHSDLLIPMKNGDLDIRPQCFGLTEIFFYGGTTSRDAPCAIRVAIPVPRLRKFRRFKIELLIGANALNPL